MVKDIAIVKLDPQPPQVVNGAVRQNRFLVRREMGVSSKVVEGIHNLAQFISKLLLTTQGSDKFDPDYGSSVNAFLKDSRSLVELKDLQAQLAIKFRDIKKQIIAAQTNLELRPDERLRDLQLGRVVFNESALKLEIDIRVISEAGTQRVLNLDPITIKDEEEE